MSVEDNIQSDNSKLMAKKLKPLKHQNKTIDEFNFNTYVRGILDEIFNKEISMKGDAEIAMTNLIIITIKKITCAINQLVSRSGVKTIKEKEVAAAINIVFSGSIRAEAVKNSEKAIQKFTNSMEKDNTENKEGNDVEGEHKAIRRSERAGLIIDIARVENLMYTQIFDDKRKGSLAAVYMTAALEHIIKTILSCAGNITKEYKKKRITPAHIKLSIYSNNDLCELYNDTIVSGYIITKSNLQDTVSVCNTVKSKTRKAPPKSVNKKIINKKVAVKKTGVKPTNTKKSSIATKTAIKTKVNNKIAAKKSTK